MAQITLKGNPVNTNGTLPAVGSNCPDFKLVKQDLSEVTLATYAGKKKVLNIFPSIDTPTCATSVRKFNEIAGKDGVAVLSVSQDLPFAAKRFCGAENLTNVETTSAFRSSFAKDFGVEMVDSGLKGLTARAVVVVDANNKVLYSELVSEIANEPNYEAALKALG